MEIALLYGLTGLAILLVLWPTHSAGKRFLRRWGITDPTEQQVSAAAHYLRDRRLLYLPLFFLLPAAATALTDLLGLPRPNPGMLHYCAILIIALLLAEVVSAVRPVRGPRVAALTPRRWHDLVPRSAVVTLLALLAFAVLLAAADLVARPWAHRIATTAAGLSQGDRDLALQPSGVLVLIGVVLGAAAVFGVVGLAVRRAPTGDPEVDAVLRTRTARVAVGIGMGWAGSLIGVAQGRLSYLDSLGLSSPGAEPAWFAAIPVFSWSILGLVVFIVSVGGWMAVTTPPKPAVPTGGAR